MSDVWLKATVLVLIFAAVAFAVERVVSVIVGRRIQTTAINQRLELINRGVSRGEAMQLLRRRTSDLPDWLPSAANGLAVKFEKMLMAAGASIPTGKLMVALLIAPISLFFVIVLIMIIGGVALGGGRLVMVATFAAIVGAGLPLLYF